MLIHSTNPSLDFAPLGSVESTPESEIVRIVDYSKKIQKDWAETPVQKRISLLRSLYDDFVTAKESIAKSVASEM